MEPSKRLERERRAQQLLHRDIPEILRTTSRAQSGLQKSTLIKNPAAVSEIPTAFNDTPRNQITIRLQPTDALQAAARISSRPYASRGGNGNGLTRRPSADAVPNVAVHSMASLTRPGGGFLTGANGQEEFLCSRTTLFPSLFEDLYPLPELGGIYTPDVLVFRNTDGVDLPKRERFFIDVITAGVPKHPDLKSRSSDSDATCSCGVSYCDRDRDIMLAKMKAVLRIAQSRGRRQLILGDWGCGPQRHPVQEVAKLWRKVLVGGSRQRKPNAEQWEGIQEVIFAIPNSERAREFRKVFDEVLASDYPSSSLLPSSEEMEGEADQEVEALLSRAASLELQIDLARGSALRCKLREELARVREDLALGRGRAARVASHQDDGFSSSDGSDNEHDEDGYVVGGYPGSDGEFDAALYRVLTSESDCDINHIPRSGTAGASEGRSEGCEYRFGARTTQYSSPDDDIDELDEFDHPDDIGLDWHAFHPDHPFVLNAGTRTRTASASSPKMTPDGWFQGSIDELSAHLYSGGPGMRKTLGDGAEGEGKASPRRTPLLVRCESGQKEAQDAEIFDGLLVRFQQTGMS